ncbi:hypothetical protein SEA_ABBA_48 [Arthrobacter phage Abba]|uniref:Uncharacterized protein n=1 Tax=Arthrobacter phage Abba TaxID=2713256 RepID=A0A6G8R2E7_9CAUD|nr:hypothetical protein HYQ28_gp48 [Arthrobacter phage Abba]QIN94377.1 hypothetical protein SEA_ABBA_48 [Arthrobacter phage Abba]
MSKRPKTAVHAFSEGGFMVRGTTDPTEAIRLAVEAVDVCEMEDITAPLQPSWYDDPDREDWRESFKLDAANYFARLLVNARVGWLRISPCGGNCGEHAWHWQDVSGPGRGNFQGVIFE